MNDQQTQKPKEPKDEAVLAAPSCSDADWKDGIHKEENGETAYYTRERRFVLRTTQDAVGWKPVWVFEAMRPNGSSHQRLVVWRADPTAPYIGAHLVNPRFLTGKAICGKRPSDVWMIADHWDEKCETCQKLIDSKQP